MPALCRCCAADVCPSPPRLHYARPLSSCGVPSLQKVEQDLGAATWAAVPLLDAQQLQARMRRLGLAPLLSETAAGESPGSHGGA